MFGFPLPCLLEVSQLTGYSMVTPIPQNTHTWLVLTVSNAALCGVAVQSTLSFSTCHFVCLFSGSVAVLFGLVSLHSSCDPPTSELGMGMHQVHVIFYFCQHTDGWRWVCCATGGYRAAITQFPPSLTSPFPHGSDTRVQSQTCVSLPN